MSLKAKIEAVIYASEEPVTLAQLTGLLGVEGQAELDAIAAQQHSLALEDEAADPTAPIDPIEDADRLNAEVLDPSEITAPTEPAPSEPEPSTDPGAPGPAPGTWDAAAPEPPSEPEPAEPAQSHPANNQPLSADEPTVTTRATDADQKVAARKLRDYFRSVLDQLIADYSNGDRGLEIREVAGGFRLATKPEYHDAVRGFVKSLKPPLKLTLQALETLAVVAYKQPVTAPEVSEIRGVDSAGVLGSLLTRKLVTTAGRKQVIGRPILYKTTKDFLLRFGLKDINELPSIEEFEKMAGELNDAVQEEIQMEQHPESTEPAHESSSETSGEIDPDPIELEGHNLQPVETPEAPEREFAEPDAPTSEPESILHSGSEASDEPDPES